MVFKNDLVKKLLKKSKLKLFKGNSPTYDPKHFFVFLYVLHISFRKTYNLTKILLVVK